MDENEQEPLVSQAGQTEQAGWMPQSGQTSPAGQAQDAPAMVTAGSPVPPPAPRSPEQPTESQEGAAPDVHGAAVPIPPARTPAPQSSTQPPAASHSAAPQPAVPQPVAADSPAPTLVTSSVPVFTPVPDHQDAQWQPRPSLTFTPFEPQTEDAPGFDGPLPASSRVSATSTDAPQVNPSGPVADDLSVDNMDQGLAQPAPLAIHPRLSSTILCIVFGLMLLAASAGVWWLGVRTANGQNFDDEVWTLLDGSLPSWLRAMVHMLTASSTIIIISVALAVVGVAVAVIRRRWWLLGQLVVFTALCYGSELLKGVLPRPYLQNIDSSPNNTAPSGHTILAAAAAVVLMCAVPRAWRAVCALVGSAYALLTALSLVAAKWHRPTDVVMSLLIVGGWALLMLAFTRTTGMDEIGTRTASASIQIVGSVMITGGIMIALYGGYLLWQIAPGLSLRAQWTQAGACAATVMLVSAASLLVFGLVLALRQLTASPLTKLGLVGAPPAPPSK